MARLFFRVFSRLSLLHSWFSWRMKQINHLKNLCSPQHNWSRLLPSTLCSCKRRVMENVAVAIIPRVKARTSKLALATWMRVQAQSKKFISTLLSRKSREKPTRSPKMSLSKRPGTLKNSKMIPMLWLHRTKRMISREQRTSHLSQETKLDWSKTCQESACFKGSSQCSLSRLSFASQVPLSNLKSSSKLCRTTWSPPLSPSRMQAQVVVARTKLTVSRCCMQDLRTQQSKTAEKNLNITRKLNPKNRSTSKHWATSQAETKPFQCQLIDRRPPLWRN